MSYLQTFFHRLDFCHFDNLTCQNEPVKATLTPPKIALKQYLGVVRPPESAFFCKGQIAGT